MKDEIVLTQNTKCVTPLGDFDCQSFPIDENKKYLITEEELIKLGKHELRWQIEEGEIIEEPIFETQYEEVEEEVDDKDNPIFEDGVFMGYNKKTIVNQIPHQVDVGKKQIVKYIVSLVENDNTAEKEKHDAKKRIIELKSFLKGTDYITIKIAEGVATKEEYADVLERRQLAREEINELEELLNTFEQVEG